MKMMTSTAQWEKQLYPEGITMAGYALGAVETLTCS